MQYEVVRDTSGGGNWCVRSFGPEGVCPIASFMGGDAHIAALEYAAWKAESDETATLRSVLFSLQMP